MIGFMLILNAHICICAGQHCPFRPWVRICNNTGTTSLADIGYYAAKPNAFVSQTVPISFCDIAWVELDRIQWIW